MFSNLETSDVISIDLLLRSRHIVYSSFDFDLAETKQLEVDGPAIN